VLVLQMNCEGVQKLNPKHLEHRYFYFFGGEITSILILWPTRFLFCASHPVFYRSRVMRVDVCGHAAAPC
jgi:hypothetical protein